MQRQRENAPGRVPKGLLTLPPGRALPDSIEIAARPRRDTAEILELRPNKRSTQL
jgi:hypothetical protein